MPRQSALVEQVVREHVGRGYYGFLLGDRDLTPVDNPTLEDAVACTLYLVHMDCRIELWIGRLLIYSEGQWGDNYIRLVEATGLNYGSLRNYKWVVSAVGDRWRLSLSFKHHQYVAKLPPDMQEWLLDRAVREKWKSGRMEQEAAAAEAALSAPSMRMEDVPPNPFLYHGDCCEILGQLPDRSVHFLLTDPPYGLAYPGGTTRVLPFDPMLNDEDIESATRLLARAFTCLIPKLIPNSPICVFGSWKTLLPMLEVVASCFTVETVVSWVKNAFGTGDVYANYGDQDELIIVAHNGSRRSARSLPQALYCDRIGTNQRRHPTQKPIAILGQLIEMFTDIGDLVLDPFMGAGSTCVAARNAGRQYRGMDIDEVYCARAVLRLADPTSGD